MREMDHKNMVNKKKAAFSCAVCLEEFSKKNNLKRHILMYNHSYGKQVPPEIQSNLPSDTPFTVTRCSKIGSSLKFQIRLLQVGTMDEFKIWLEKFMALQKCRFVCHGKKRRPSKRYAHVAIYHCEYRGNGKIKKKPLKATGCTSSICASMKPSDPKYTTIRFHIGHNHDFGVQNKPKSPSVEVKNIFIKMFDNGFSPKQAIQSFRDHIRKQITSDSEFNKFINDKEKFPKYYWVWNLHKSYFLKKNSQEVDIVKGFKELVENRNAEFNECVCSYRRFDEENYCVAIMTPFMKRISQASEASQLVFMDSAGSIEKYGLKVYSLMCKTKAGVAPLGLVITNNDTDLCIEKSLRLLLQLGDGRSFGGRSTRSPIFFMTKDSSAEISALRSVFPKCIHLLSTYHVLQTLYRWLFNSVHQISEETRYRIYVLIRKMIYAENEEDIETYYHQVEKYFGENSQAFEYFQSLYERKEKWMLYYRNLPQVKGSSFTNSIEKYICVLKNHVLNRIKLQSLTLLVDYLIKGYSQSYVEKFLNHIRSDTCDKPEESILAQMNNYQFFRSSECSTIYVVSNQSKGVMYETNYEIGTCTCFVGVNGSSACKHQQMLLYYLRQMNKTSSNLQNEDDKSEVYYLATGNSAIPNEFFQPVNEVVEELVNIEDHITEEVIDLDDCITYEETPNVNLNDDQDEMRTEFNNFKKTVNEMLTMLEANPNYYKEGIKSFQDALHQVIKTPYRLREFLLTQPKR